jgi:hypothetical protein
MRSTLVRTAVSIAALLALAACRPPGVTRRPTDTPALTATPTVAAPTATTVPQPEPTLTPQPEDVVVDIDDLPIGQPGHYINLTFGYWLQYPDTWHTGFGNRPLMASFSNLDPGTHNRHSMRSEGCLIEVNVMSNVFGFKPEQVASQLARALPNSSPIDLAGSGAVRSIQPSQESSGVTSELILAEHDSRLFSITLEYARGADDICLPVWRQLIETWQWLDPAFVVYRNATFGYAMSYPRGWHTFDSQTEGISLSSNQPVGQSELELLADGMVVRTTVFDNVDDLPLQEWLVAQDWGVDLADQIPVNGLLGVRILRNGPSAEIQEMSGYFQGPLGRIYAVTCLYPKARAEEFEPIANLILFSFSF